MSKKKAAFKGLPKSVRVGQRAYKIHTRTEETDTHLSGSFAYTMTSYDHIILRANMSIGQARSTLIHELLHAIDVVYGNPSATLDNGSDKDDDDDDNEGTRDQWEHFFINLYQEPIVSLFRDNPDLVTFILAKD